MAKPTIKSYLEAGVQFTEMSKQQAEAWSRRSSSPATCAARTRRSSSNRCCAGRETTERISALVHSEVAKQIEALSERFDDVEGRIESLAVSSGAASSAARPGRARRPHHNRRRRHRARRTAQRPLPEQSAAKKSTKTRQEGGRQEWAPRSRPPRSGGQEASGQEVGRQEGAGQEEGAQAVGGPGGRPWCRRCGRHVGGPQGADDAARHDLRVSGRRRLDAELVRRGLVSSRSEANAADRRASGVGQRRDRRQAGPPGGPRRPAGRQRPTVPIRRARRAQARARPGDVRDRRRRRTGARRRGIDGGFTDCLLQRGAASVVAVDVGHGQLHERLRADPRVENVERTNIRQIDAATIGGPVDMVVGDLSFISLRLVIAPLGRRMPAWGSDGPARQAAIRGRSRRGQPRAGSHQRPRGVGTRQARGGASR